MSGFCCDVTARHVVLLCVMDLSASGQQNQGDIGEAGRSRILVSYKFGIENDGLSD